MFLILASCWGLPDKSSKSGVNRINWMTIRWIGRESGISVESISPRIQVLSQHQTRVYFQPKSLHIQRYSANKTAATAEWKSIKNRYEDGIPYTCDGISRTWDEMTQWENCRGSEGKWMRWFGNKSGTGVLETGGNGSPCGTTACIFHPALLLRVLSPTRWMDNYWSVAELRCFFDLWARGRLCFKARHVEVLVFGPWHLYHHYDYTLSVEKLAYKKSWPDSGKIYRVKSSHSLSAVFRLWHIHAS